MLHNRSLITMVDAVIKLLLVFSFCFIVFFMVLNRIRINVVLKFEWFKLIKKSRFEGYAFRMIGIEQYY